MNEFQKCFEQKRIVKITPTKEMIDKEMTSAEYDLKMADESLLKNDSKWASVQAYYSLFHCAKATKLECCGFCARLQEEIGDDLENCMDIRHEADYGLTYDNESAKLCIDAARNLLNSAEKILSKQSEKKE